MTGSSAHGLAARINLGGIGVDAFTAGQVIELVRQGWSVGRGSWIVTPNVDIWRAARRDSRCAELIARAGIVLADGMPLVWASRLAGTPVPERVAGSELVELLAQAAASQGRSVHVVGGGQGNTAQLAGEALAGRYPGLRLAGWTVPPFGFEDHPRQYTDVLQRIVESQADLVLVGLGFPKQEHLAEDLHARMPGTWLIGCGGGVAMAAGLVQRSPRWAQRIGAEWMVRLIQEPRRLARRYLIDDVPAAVLLLVLALRSRLRSRSGGFPLDS
ncbi:MAG: WecB/TagA/CpsF family glycosyltransferase [Actinomycetota bacterium]